MWLDPSRAVPFAFVSHAHADHFAPHQRILCSKGTHALIRARFGKKDTEFTVLDFGESHVENGMKFTVFPAGHIAGSAQLLVEDTETGDSLIYTGDFKTRPSLAAEPIEVRQAGILIMETTFGLPRYILPPNDETLSRIAHFVLDTLEDGKTPIVQGYSLGKAQELIAGIHQHHPDLKFQVHSSVQRMNRALTKLGFSLPQCVEFNPSKPNPDGHVLVVPPTASHSKAVRSLKNTRSCVATGWAINSGAKFRYQVDEAFPLSDHAGYDDLLSFVEAVDPDVVYTLHGSASRFAADLRSRGREAWSLIGENQLELDLGLPHPILDSTSSSQEIPLDLSGGLALLTSVCQQIRDTSGKNQKRDILAAYFRNLPKDHLEYVPLFLSGKCFPPSNPDGERRTTGTGWASIKRALIKAADVSEAEYLDISASQADGARTAHLAFGRKGRGPASLHQ